MPRLPFLADASASFVVVIALAVAIALYVNYTSAGYQPR